MTSIDPYHRIAPFYDFFVEPFNAVLRHISFNMYPPRDRMSVLEVGCGTGTNLLRYKNAGCDVQGIDLSRSMLDMAEKKLGDKSLLRWGDASRMPYKNDTFDLVLAMLTLHEMSGPMRPAAVKEMSRVMKPEGRMLIVDFHPGPLKIPQGWFSRLLILGIERVAGSEHYRNQKEFLSDGGILPLLEQHRLVMEKEKIVAHGNLGLYLVKNNQ